MSQIRDAQPNELNDFLIARSLLECKHQYGRCSIKVASPQIIGVKNYGNVSRFRADRRMMKASKTSRVIVSVILTMCILNYILHNMQFCLIGESFVNVLLSRAEKIEVSRMLSTPGLSDAAISYASFLASISIQMIASLFLLLYLIARQLLLFIRLIPQQEIERPHLLAGMVVTFLMVVAYTVPDGATVIFLENRRLPHSLWVRTLFLALPSCMILVGLTGFILFPQNFNQNARIGG